MMCFGLWMCIKEKQLQARKIDSEIWKIFFAGRCVQDVRFPICFS